MNKTFPTKYTSSLIIFRAHEGYLDQGIMVKDSRLLRSNYMKTRQIKIDILSVFPTDLLYLVFDNSCYEVTVQWEKKKILKRFKIHSQVMPCLVIVRLNRILR